jgi:iron complex outermembrane receptor protein
MRLLQLFLLQFSLFLSLSGQKIKIYGTVTDDKDSAMIGVTIAIKGTAAGTISDSVGKYELQADPGTHEVEYSFIGYTTRSVLITALEPGKQIKKDIQLSDSTVNVDIVVVTGSKYDKKLSEEVASIEVVKAAMIEQSNSKMDEAMNRVPGVNVLGKSIAIRGGSGFADITSNRVLALLDGLPIISPENGGILWDMMPIEELEQVEVIKGSSSSLYGSSSLDGIINMVTVNPQAQTENKLILSYGFYGQPNNKEWDWWWRTSYTNEKRKTITKIQPRMFGGGQYMHRQQYKDVGVVISGAYQQNQNYLQNDDYLLARLGAKMRYIPHKNQHVTLGVNLNAYYKQSKDFFVATNVDSGMYQGATTPPIVRQHAINVDPYLNYYDEHDNKQSIRFRVFNVLYQSAAVQYFASGDSTTSTEYYLDYTYSHNFRKAGLVLTAGANGFVSIVRGRTFVPVDTNITAPVKIGTNDVKNVAAFIQFEKKFFKRLTVEGGLRFEYAQLEDTTVQNRLPLVNALSEAFGHKKDINSPVTPLGRIGINYQATEGTFIRGSFGQGFRYPSLSEKYTYTLRSGAQVFPNDSLKPENGWMAEVGIKQGVKISRWLAYFDVSGFIMRYHDMIEFEAYNNYPSYVQVVGIPFQAQNIDNARIAGTEFSTVANGSIFGVPLTFLIGYTYTYPQNLSYNPSDPNSTPLLKYRIQHNVKADIQSNYKGAVLGISAFYGSFMKYIDNAQLGALDVIREFRLLHPNGEFVMDVRAGYNYHDKATFMFICKNVLNTEYMLQPGIVEAPRNFTFQVGYNF